MTLLVAVLTDRSPDKLERCLKSIDDQNQTVGRVVICNTLDPLHAPLAQEVAERHGWKFIVTESNGTCSRGKNSVLEYFLETDYDHLTLIDGDDYHEPGSLAILTTLVDIYSPDAVGLIGSSVVYDDQRIPLTVWEQSVDWRNKIVKNVVNSHSLRKLIVLYAKSRKLLEFNRLVLFSRKAVETCKFSEAVGLDDFHLSIRLKHYNNIGELNYLILDSDSVYTYDGNEFGGFANILHSETDERIATFWKELDGLDLSGAVTTVKK